jgi:hypothetical protein
MKFYFARSLSSNGKYVLNVSVIFTKTAEYNLSDIKLECMNVDYFINPCDKFTHVGRIGNNTVSNLTV